MSIICNKGKFEHTKQLFQPNKILNVYKLNILNVAIFMHKVIKNLLLMFFFQDFKNRIIFTQLDSRNWTIYNQSTILKLVNTQFQLEDHISVIAFLSPKRNKSLLCINLKLLHFLRERTQIFRKGTFSIHKAFCRTAVLNDIQRQLLVLSL